LPNDFSMSAEPHVGHAPGRTFARTLRVIRHAGQARKLPRPFFRAILR